MATHKFSFRFFILFLFFKFSSTLVCYKSTSGQEWKPENETCHDSQKFCLITSGLNSEGILQMSAMCSVSDGFDLGCHYVEKMGSLTENFFCLCEKNKCNDKEWHNIEYWRFKIKNANIQKRGLVVQDTTTKLPETPTSELPETPTSELPETPTSELPETPTSELPETPTSELPETSTSELPETPTSELPKKPTSELSETPTIKPAETTKKTATTTTTTIIKTSPKNDLNGKSSSLMSFFQLKFILVLFFIISFL